MVCLIKVRVRVRVRVIHCKMNRASDSKRETNWHLETGTAKVGFTKAKRLQEKVMSDDGTLFPISIYRQYYRHFDGPVNQIWVASTLAATKSRCVQLSRHISDKHLN